MEEVEEMKGWYNEPQRHSLASRGIQSVHNPIPLRIQTHFEPSGLYGGDGYIFINQGEKNIGYTDVIIDRSHMIRMFDEDIVPPRTAVTSILRVNDPWKGQGFGKKLMRMMEDYAREHGMDRVWGIGVVNHEFVEKQGYRKIHNIPLIGSVYEKVL